MGRRPVPWQPPVCQFFNENALLRYKETNRRGGERRSGFPEGPLGDGQPFSAAKWCAVAGSLVWPASYRLR